MHIFTAVAQVKKNIKSYITSSLISSTEDKEISTLVSDRSQASEQTGPLDDDKALQELKSLGKALKALHLQIKFKQSSEEWIQVGLIMDRLLFSLYILFISVSFITIIIIWVRSYNTV